MMLIHMPCGKKVVFTEPGKGKCPGCGQSIHVKISNK